MTRRIKVVNKNAGTIRSTSQQESGIDPVQIEHGIGAEKMVLTASLKGSLYSLTALRQELAERLCSTGGRRSLEDVIRRQKIHMTDEDWKRLEKLAELQKKRQYPTGAPAKQPAFYYIKPLKNLKKRLLRIMYNLSVVPSYKRFKA
ncbi:MAG TPA: hypothetical protein DIT99_00760 [Candidatus Latescibacteria bacterium]|nr:hypothetical protein [Candidatus Latescibacterota bacterium]